MTTDVPARREEAQRPAADFQVRCTAPTRPPRQRWRAPRRPPAHVSLPPLPSQARPPRGTLRSLAKSVARSFTGCDTGKPGRSHGATVASRTGFANPTGRDLWKYDTVIIT